MDLIKKTKFDKKNLTRLLGKTEFINTYIDKETKLPNEVYAFELINNMSNRVGCKFFLIIIEALINECDSDNGFKFLIRITSKLLKNRRDWKCNFIKLSYNEFLIISVVDDEIKIKRLINQIESYFKCYKPYHLNPIIGLKIGYSICPKYEKIVDRLIFKARKNKKLIYSDVDHDMVVLNNVRSDLHRDRDIAEKLIESISRNELFMVYQPKISTITNEICGTEALVRWFDKELGEVAPSEFVCVAERYGIMNYLGDWIIETVCHQMWEWHQKGLSLSGRMSINISVQQLESLGFLENFIKILNYYNINADKIDLEITESILIDFYKLKDTFIKIKKFGFNISIDDFGTGYSSFSYLRTSFINTLKIDRVFVKNMLVNLNDEIIVCSIVELAKKLGLQVIAEGVETEEQLLYLVSIGCYEVQGYYFFKPLSAEDFSTSYMNK
jgi:EAL domain-containing protein (putative c-di-GMP-specific phosphodiesterase class I)